MINKVDAGKRIKYIRKELEMIQGEFAARLNVSTQAVSKWETGNSLPDLDTLLKISWIGNKTINNILEGEENYINASSDIDRGYQQVSRFLMCPECKQKLELRTNAKIKPEFICSCGKKYSVIDGVIDFGTREVRGELWSLYLKNYDNYLELQNSSGNPRYQQGNPNMTETKWMEINKRQPRLILDIASGTGSGIKYMIRRINWPCLVVMTDLSHRILKWNNRYFSKEVNNPYVDIVYLACDCSKLPISDNAIDAITSTGGFQSMQNKMMPGFSEAIRVLKDGGVSIYDMNVIDNHNSESTKKWIALTTQVYKDMNIDIPNFYNVEEWKKACMELGFIHSETFKIYEELPAPDTDTFPFRNEVFQWMGEYVAVSKK